MDLRSFEARLVAGTHHILILKPDTIRSPKGGTALFGKEGGVLFDYEFRVSVIPSISCPPV